MWIPVSKTYPTPWYYAAFLYMIAHRSNRHTLALGVQALWIQKLWTDHFALNNKKRVTASQITWIPPEPGLRARPDIREYCLQPLTIWAPEVTFNAFVAHMPCPVDGCSALTTRQSYTRPRAVQGLDRSEILVQARYQCPAHGCFNSGATKSIARLPPHVQSAFPYILSEGTGVTKP